MSNASANGYIGERSQKFSSIFADTYVVPRTADPGDAIVDAGNTRMDGTSGRVLFGAVNPAAASAVRMQVRSTAIGASSIVVISIHNVTPAADEEVLNVYVDAVVQGSFDVVVANISAAAALSAPIALDLSFLVFNVSA